MRVKREEQKYLRQITNKCFLGQGNFKKEEDCVRWKPSSVTNKSDSEDAMTETKGEWAPRKKPLRKVHLRK